MKPCSLTILLPLPAKPLHANYTVATHGSRMARHEATIRYRKLAEDAVRAQDVSGWERAVAQATFYWPNKLRRDIRNAEYALKPAYDGMVDAELIPDDSYEHLTHQPTRFEIDKKYPRVEITVTEGDCNDEGK